MSSEMPQNNEQTADEVLVERDKGVAIVSLNRPDSLNALQSSIMGLLRIKMEEVADDPEIGCVVVTGEGRGFCSGGDLKEGRVRTTINRNEGGPTEQGSLRLRSFMESSRLLHEMPKPTIAMINGPVAGAGIGLAGACDLRFAGKSATFLTAFDRIGGSGDFGSSWFWTQIIGTGKTRELFFLGEKLTAEEAFEKGLYTRLYEDEELRDKTMEVAYKLAKGPRMAWRYMKSNLNLAEDGTFEQSLDQEAMNMGLSTRATASIYKALKEAKDSKN